MKILLLHLVDSAISPGTLPQSLASPTAVQTVLSIIFDIIGALALLMVVVSGLRYVLSAGDPQKITKARNGIIYSLVGLAVAIAAEAIVNFVANGV